MAARLNQKKSTNMDKVTQFFIKLIVIALTWEITYHLLNYFTR